MQLECPCKDCKRKGCGAYHDKCEEYQTYRAKQNAENERRRTEYEENFIPSMAEIKWRKYRRKR